MLSASAQRAAWEVLRHRGGQLSQALEELEAPAPSSRDAGQCAPASCADAAKCVMQVDKKKKTGLDTHPASSGDVAGCDEDLFTEEVTEESLSGSLSEGTVVRIVGLQKWWKVNFRTERLLGPGELDGRVPVLVQEQLLGGVVFAKEERARVNVDNNGMDEQRRPLCKKSLRNCGSPGEVQQIFR